MVQLTRKEEIKPLKTLYKSESGVFKCLECDDESFKKERDVVTHAKKHRMKFIATLAEENGQLIEYRTSPFIFNGLTSPRPLIMGKGKTNKEVVNEACTLKAENIILKEIIKRLEVLIPIIYIKPVQNTHFLKKILINAIIMSN